MPLTRRDWALLAVAAADGQPLSPVQLQKALFLLGRELGHLVGPDFYEFEPYNYGPFDLSVYRDAEHLANQKLVAINRPPDLRYDEYSVTPLGLEAAGNLRARAPKEAVDYLQRVVTWARDLSFSDLVSAIYARYPEMRANSVFRS